MNRLVCVFAIFCASILAGCSQQSPPATLRVMSYNIHHGEGLDKQLDLERIAAIIRAARPDLVALQEVDRNTARTHRVDQPARLAELTGMQVVFEKNIDLQGGEYGNAVLSRLPVVRHQNHHLPKLAPPSEQRGLLEVHVRWDQGTVIFFATHFDHRPDEGERLASVGVLRDLIATYPANPVIVAGDLNARPSSRTIMEAATFLRDTHAADDDPGYSFPADTPSKRIDYILHNGHAAFTRTQCFVLDEPVASDHRPILAAFEIDLRQWPRD